MTDICTGTRFSIVVEVLSYIQTESTDLALQLRQTNSLYLCMFELTKKSSLVSSHAHVRTHSFVFIQCPP